MFTIHPHECLTRLQCLNPVAGVTVRQMDPRNIAIPVLRPKAFPASLPRLYKPACSAGLLKLMALRRLRTPSPDYERSGKASFSTTSFISAERSHRLLLDLVLFANFRCGRPAASPSSSVVIILSRKLEVCSLHRPIGPASTGNTCSRRHRSAAPQSYRKLQSVSNEQYRCPLLRPYAAFCQS